MNEDILILLTKPKSEALKELFLLGDFLQLVTKKTGEVNYKALEALQNLTDKEVKELAYGGAAGGAKSWTGATWLFFMCLLYPDTRWFIGREELKRLRESTLITFFKVAKEYQITGWKYNGQDHFIQFDNGSRIDLLELKFLPSDPLYERYGSTEYTGGWIEEGGEIDFGAYDTLKSRIGRQNNERYGILAKIFITMNPKKNWVYEYFWKPYKENQLPDGLKFIQSFVYDNPFNDKGYIERLEAISDPVRRARLLEGDFEYDDNPLSMIEYDKILELFTNSFIEPSEPKYLTADIAYEGSDMFVIGIWQGYVLSEIVAMDKCDETQVSKVIHELRVKHSIHLGNVIYDADGLKTFVRQSALTGNLNGAKQFHNNGKPESDENYFNLKSQCYFKLADFVNTNKIYILAKDYRKQIIEELEQMRKLVTPDDNKLRVEKKDDLKKRLRRSPDFMDMLAMRMFFELKPKTTSRTRIMN